MIQESKENVVNRHQEVAERFYWLFTYKEGNRYIGMHISIKNPKQKDVKCSVLVLIMPTLENLM